MAQPNRGNRRSTAVGRGAPTSVCLLAALAGALGCIPPPEQSPRRPARTEQRPRAATPSRLTAPRLTGTVLPSGLRVLLDEDPFALSIGVISVVRGGSGDDPVGAEGLAHLVEHLSYRAVDPPLAGERAMTRWDRLTTYAVADMNGFTTQDWLLFYEFAPLDRLPAVLKLEAMRLANPLAGVDDNAFKLERQVIGSEHLMREDPRAGGWAMNALVPLLFPADHPYARPVGGTEETRRKLTLAQARTYATQTFRPERITLLVTAPPGLTTLNAVIDTLPPALQGDPKQPVTRPQPATEAAVSSTPPLPASGPPMKIHRKRSPLPTSELWMAWTLPGAATGGNMGATEQVLEQWAQEDIGSAQLTQEEPRIRHVSVSLRPGTQASILFVRVLLASGAAPERAAQVVAARVASLWAREPTEQETFARFKDLLETQRLLQKPQQTGRALAEAVAAAMTERSQNMSELLGSMRAVASADVAQLAYRHLTRDRAQAVMFTPSAATADVARSGAPWTASARDGGPPELVTGAGTWDAGELQRLLPPAVPVVTTTLPSGLTVITARRPSAAVSAWLGFRGGYANADPPLLVELAMRTRPDAREATKLHILPGRGATQDLSFDMVEFLPSQLADGLMLLFAKATAPVKEWPTPEGMQRLLAPFAAAEDGSATKAGRDFWTALFGDHPYANLVHSSDVDKFTQSDVDAWLGRVHTMRNAAVVVVGDVDADEVEKAAEILSRRLSGPTWIADIPAPAAPQARPPTGERTTGVVTGRPGSLTEIRMGCLLPPLSLADRGHYELLKHAMEARLNSALRIDQGDGYGVNVSYDWLRGGTTYLVASTFINDQSLPRTLGTMRSHWQRWGRDGFDAGEISVARRRYAGTLPLAQASGHGVAYQLLAVWNSEPKALSQAHGRPDIVALRAARVNELFAGCRANAVLGITGNEPVIRRALEQAWPGLSAPRQRPHSP